MPRFRLNEWMPWSRDRVMAARGWHAGLSDEQIDRLTRDIDESLSGIELVTRPQAGPAVLMYERLQRLGLEPREIALAEPDLLEALEATCETCGHWRHCARDLVRPGAHSDSLDYCPNAQRFAGLVRARRGGMRTKD